MAKRADRPGRLPKLDPAVHKTIVECVRGGTPRQHAAAIAGVGLRTLMRWLARGRKDAAGPYWQLWQDVKRAEAQFVAHNVAAIEAAGSDSWQARAWLLERRHPDEFSLQKQELAALRREMAELLKRLEQQNGTPPGPVGEAPPR